GCSGAPGVAAAARPVRAARRAARSAGVHARSRVDRGQSAAARRAAGTGGVGGQAVRAAPRSALAEPVRRLRARGGGGRPAEREVDPVAHRPLWTVADPHTGPGPVLLPRLRWRRAG